MIDLTIHEDVLKRSLERARKNHIVIPTFAQMKNPDLIPDKIKEGLKGIGLWDVSPLNLFRISWRNEPILHGGLFGPANFLEIPSEISGVDARIIALVGKWFPTGAHKVGATFACLVPRLVTGQFDPTREKAVWPSTGNFCRGGAFNAAILGCESIALLPEEMSRERFEWLSRLAGEVIPTPGSESNVKEIFDKCNELLRTRNDVSIFNQFAEFGNHLWHYDVTGRAVEEVFATVAEAGDRLAAFVSQTGSAGTIGAGDYVKEKFRGAKVAASEALQCPTLLYNGYGAHRIEGIGDKHIPWIYNARNTDMVMAVDDESCINLLRLFNEPAGKEFLIGQGVPESFWEELSLFGISSIANLVSCIKLAKYFELTQRDIVFTVLTDSIDLYQTRLEEQRNRYGPYRKIDAARDYHRHLMGQSTDHLLELRYTEKKRIHNLKYFTWVEQQGESVEELDRQWYAYPEFWDQIHRQVDEIDQLIQDFNARSGVLLDP